MLDEQNPAPPASLKPDGPGVQLWWWVFEHFDGAEECSPLVEHLCTQRDLIRVVEVKLQEQGLLVCGNRGGRQVRNPLIDTLIRLQAQFGKTWGLLGLSDKAPGERRPPGRPPGS